ncbi:TonB-dependent receptor plug domain-containing protein [Candidatus Marithrix sp. Canyon 246]|uniref:TonB-dependent receptor plug domain-containing protein n=2 Tax=Candidatus Marithrix sp. Canyon 246 TaxID=1827136 RepID=UPI00084A21D4|nr:TonB-dependent receptor [Candidatus Marithrix sp. Canyon 246]
MQKQILKIIYLSLLTIYSSNSFAGSCGSVYDEELGWLQEVEVASGQAEPLSEVPAPVTVINSDMMRSIGARTLKDVLITYVPGMTNVQNQGDINVASHGVYSASQQKILIMLNGHRLNSASYLSANPDFSINLDKLECIEVLRAPGSSLYGNAALTAVINLITKKGTDVNGTEITVGIGNYGQRKVSFLFGNEFDNGKSDLLLWGSYYTSEGEIASVPVNEDYSRDPKDSYAILDGVKDPGSYDIGLTYEFGDFTLLASQRRARYITPFSQVSNSQILSLGGGESYNYSDYRQLHGVGPGQAATFSHLGMDYVKEFENNFKLQFQVYYDETESNRLIINKEAIKNAGFLSFYDRGYGVIAQLSKPYNFFGTGRWMIGTQINTMELYDSNLIFGENGEWVKFMDNRENNVFDTGTETITSLFTQIKHNFTDTLLGNFGVRFDKKDRHEGENISEISPRLALVWKPYDKFNLKFSYSKAFVDAPYVFQYYNDPQNPNNQLTLKPETMESYQVTPTFKLAQGKITSSFNIFYNKFSNVIMRHNHAHQGQSAIQNHGFFNQWGIENETSYNQNAYNLAFNLTYQAAANSEDNEGISDEKVWNVPNFTANLILNVNPFELFNFNNETVSQDLWLNLTAKYIGEQLSPIDIEYPNGTSFHEPNNEVDDVVLFNTGFRWDKLWKDFFLDARVYNLLDEDYYQGGSVTHPYPQAGRWFMLTVGYKGNW